MSIYRRALFFLSRSSKKNLKITRTEERKSEAYAVTTITIATLT